MLEAAVLYQLDLTSSLKPDVSILLNVTPDHLDRHGGMDGYVKAKRRVLLNQGKGDTAVIGVDDAYGQQICTEITAANRRTIVPISAKTAIGRGVYALQGLLYDATGDRVLEVCDLERVPSLHRPLAQRSSERRSPPMPPCGRWGWPCRWKDAATGLSTFPGLAHRMETIAVVDGIRFINDSKATNRATPRAGAGDELLSEGSTDRRRAALPRPAGSTT